MSVKGEGLKSTEVCCYLWLVFSFRSKSNCFRRLGENSEDCRICQHSDVVDFVVSIVIRHGVKSQKELGKS